MHLVRLNESYLKSKKMSKHEQKLYTATSLSNGKGPYIAYFDSPEHGVIYGEIRLIRENFGGGTRYFDDVNYPMPDRNNYAEIDMTFYVETDTPLTFEVWSGESAYKDDDDRAVKEYRKACREIKAGRDPREILDAEVGRGTQTFSQSLLDTLLKNIH